MSSTELEDAVEAVEPDVTETAESSSAEPEGGKSTLELVQEALGEQEASPTSENGADQPEANAQEAEPTEAEPSEDELSEEEKRHLSQRSQNRFQRLVEQKKAFEAQLSEVRPKAENFDRFIDYLRRNDLTEEDVDNTLTIASLIKTGNAIEAYKRVLPIFQTLSRAVGAELPAEYQERVRLGHMNEQDARRMAQAEAASRIQATQLQRMQQQAQAEAMRQQHVQLQTQVVGAGEQWARTKAQSDPDWNLRESLVSDLIAARMRTEGVPNTAQAVIELCEQVDQQVIGQLKKFGTPKREVRPVTGVGSSPRSTPEPKSTLDVINNALAGIR